MSMQGNEFLVDEMLERAYRLALGVHGLASDKLSEERDLTAASLSLWVMASELLGLLDEARAIRITHAALCDALHPTPD